MRVIRRYRSGYGYRGVPYDATTEPEPEPESRLRRINRHAREGLRASRERAERNGLGSVGSNRMRFRFGRGEA